MTLWGCWTRRLWQPVALQKRFVTVQNVVKPRKTPQLKRKLGQHLLVSESILEEIVKSAQIPQLVEAKRSWTKQQLQQHHDNQQKPDADTAASITITAVDPSEIKLNILEIGPGTGNLTSALLHEAPEVRVHVVEYDRRMVKTLKERFDKQPDLRARLTMERCDFEDFAFVKHAPLADCDADDLLEDSDDEDDYDDEEEDDWDDEESDDSDDEEDEDDEETESDESVASGPVFDACVANIPYQLSSLILSRLSNYMFMYPQQFRCAVLLVQEEFAQRLLAKPGHQNYTRLSVNTSLVAQVSSVVEVDRKHFLPPPRVDSRVIKLVPLESPIVPTDPKTRKLFLQKFDTLLRVCFLRKNKTIRALLIAKTTQNYTKKRLPHDVFKQTIQQVLVKCDLVSKRPVQLSNVDFFNLMNELEAHGIEFVPSETRHFND